MESMTEPTNPTIDQMVAAAATEVQPPKRGRGRPKGSTTRRPTAADDLAAAVTGGPQPDGARKPGRPGNSAKMQESLTGLYQALGGALLMASLVLRNPRLAAAAEATTENASACASSLVAWADINPKVKKALDSLATGGGAMVVLIAHAPIVMAAMAPPAEAGMAAELLGMADVLNLFGGGAPAWAPSRRRSAPSA